MKTNGDNQNFIVTKIQYVTTRALIDSGATRSCISAKFLQKLHLTPTPLSPDEPQVLFTANKSALRNLGTVELNVCIQGLVIPFTFCVFSDLAYSVVLGLDFLTTAQADINCYDKVISFYQGLVTTNLITNGADETVFLLSQAVEIPPNSKLYYQSTRENSVLTETICWNLGLPIKNKLIAVAPALVRPENGSTCCRVLNLASTPRRLAKNSPIAVLSQINDRDQHNYKVLRQHSILNLSEGKELTYNQKLEYLQGLGIPFKDTKLNSDQMENL
jgi:hypothetical protein